MNRERFGITDWFSAIYFVILSFACVIAGAVKYKTTFNGKNR